LSQIIKSSLTSELLLGLVGLAFLLLLLLLLLILVVVVAVAVAEEMMSECCLSSLTHSGEVSSSSFDHLQPSQADGSSSQEIIRVAAVVVAVVLLFCSLIFSSRYTFLLGLITLWIDATKFAQQPG
jgi:hypothetical protein